MNLLLLTSNFPYYPGEQFLESEVDVLARNFDKVSIIPLSLCIRSDKPPRPVPKNIEIFRIPQNLTNISKRFTALRAAAVPRSITDLGNAAIRTRSICASEVYSLCRKYFTASLLSSLVEKKVDVGKFTVIYSYWGAEIGLVLHFFKRQSTGQAVFATRMHGYDLYAERQGLKKLPFQEQILDSCDIIAPCSKHGEAYLHDLYPLQSKKIKSFYLGVATQSTTNEGSLDDTLRIVTCSFAVPVKRLELLAAALSMVSRKVKWTHIGDGPDLNKICLLSKRLPQNIETTFLGHLGNENVLRFYRDNPVDLFVNVSSCEGIPVSIMEALSFGIETIATNVGGVAELVRPAFGTLIEPEFEPEMLADVLQRHKNCQEHRMKAQEYQRNNFSFANYQSFAGELLASCGRKRGEN